jgi:hypothetical protein
MFRRQEERTPRPRTIVATVVALGALALLMAAGSPAVASGEGGDHLPDLEAVNLWADPHGPGPEGETVLHAFVWNRSDVVVEGPIRVVIGIEGVGAEDRALPALHPWEAVPVDAAFPPLEFGEYEAFVEIDPENEIPEEIEENNGAFAPLHVAPPPRLPDLAVIDLRVEPPDPMPGDEVVVEGMVWNGSMVAVDEPIVARFWIDDRPAGEPVVIGGLFPREAHRIGVVVGPLEAGEHVAFLQVDPENHIPELEEENNEGAVRFEVHPPPEVAVDLVPLSERVLPPDGVLVFEARLANHTDELIAFPFRLQVRAAGPGGHVFQEKVIPFELGPGEEAGDVVEMPLPQDPPLEPGIYVVEAEAGDFDRDAFDFEVEWLD